MQQVAALRWGTDESDAEGLRRTIGRGLREVFVAAADDPTRIRPLWTLFSRGDPLPLAKASRALGEPLLAAALEGGVLAAFEIDDEVWVRAEVSVLTAPVGELGVLVAADFGWHEDDREYVGGPGNATATLLDVVASLDVPPGLAVDVGTGSGAVAVWLRSRFATVTATDVNPRALALAELTAALNDSQIDVVQMSFVDGLTGDAALIACNPPFVVGADAPVVFRDAHPGLDPAMLAASFRAHLAPGGYAVLLANWPYRDGADARAALAAALDEVTDDASDVLLVERAVTTPEQYAAVWRDDPDEQQAWAMRLRGDGILGVGSGFIVIAAAGDDEPGQVDVAAAHQASDEPVGTAVGAWAARVRALREGDDDLASLVVRAAPAQQAEHAGVGVLRAGGPLGLAVHGPAVQIAQVAQPLLAECTEPRRVGDAIEAVPMARTLGRSAIFSLVRALVRTGLLVPCEVASTSGNKSNSETLH
ncbi:methyltransferase [Epidermidibacterium keratini]|uniref:Methyltransferase n=1 Tax=Epidermidibacterium keratini TaxID=1891644 RepID=A0A7L4YSB4_9ACTN|nr:methyltransferase [Epidermidibacterium keratini]QHC01948.1 methyltransferase [Epidermidibacterium keratini]